MYTSSNLLPSTKALTSDPSLFWILISDWTIPPLVVRGSPPEGPTGKSGSPLAFDRLFAGFFRFFVFVYTFPRLCDDLSRALGLILFACVFIVDSSTSTTFHLTAPHKFTVTLNVFAFHLRVISLTATQKITAIWPSRGLVTKPSRSARNSQFVISVAVIRRGIYVHHWTLGNLEFASFMFSFLPERSNKHGVVVFRLQIAANLNELGHGFPTRFHRARTRNAMAPAWFLHEIPNSL